MSNRSKCWYCGKTLSGFTVSFVSRLKVDKAHYFCVPLSQPRGTYIINRQEIV